MVEVGYGKEGKGWGAEPNARGGTTVSCEVQEGAGTEATAVEFTKSSHRDDPQSDKVPCGFGLAIRCERASTALNGLPRLVERGGQDADFFGIEDARLGVYFKKLVHCPRFLPGL